MAQGRKTARLNNTKVTIYLALIGMCIAFGTHQLAQSWFLPMAEITLWQTIGLVTFTAGPATAVAGLAIRSNLQLQQQLHLIANTDTLTGLTAPQAFLRDAERLRSAEMGVLVIFDIDQLKQINDRYGYEIGDETLRAVATELRRRCPIEHIVARMNGGCFGLFAPTETIQEMSPLINELCRGITLSQPMGRRVTLSAGVTALYPAEPLEESMTRARRALGSAKQSGRNKMEVALRPLTAVA